MCSNIRLVLGNVIPEEASDYVGDILNNEFNTLCEDGSLEEVGERLCRFYRLIQTGQLEEVTAELKTFKGSGVQECKKQITPNSEDVVSPMNNLSVDEEGGYICVGAPKYMLGLNLS